MPLLVVYNDNQNEVLLQISDLFDFYDKEELEDSDIEALLIKSNIVTDTKNCSEESKNKVESLPVVVNNSEINEQFLADKQKEIDVYQDKDQGLENFVSKPLLDQFNELFKITEDPLDKIIKSMESKGDDKYATFNLDDIEFYPDAFNQEI